MLHRLQNPVNRDGWGVAIQIFQPPNDHFHFVESVLNNGNHNPEDVARVHEQTESFYFVLNTQPYARRLPDWIHGFNKEVISLDPSNRAVVSLARHQGTQTCCTMREVLCGHTLLTQPGNREQLISMALDIRIITQIRHVNIVQILSIDIHPPTDRYLLFYELSVPLLYYVKERAFIDREDSVAVFDNPNIAKYIIKGAASAMSHLVKYGIYLSQNILTAIYIDYDGIPKLGSFLDAKPTRNFTDHREDLAALCAVYVALLNRHMPQDELHALLPHAVFPITRNVFINTYIATRGLFPPHVGEAVEGVFLVGNVNYAFVQRFFHDVVQYFDLPHQLGLTNMPDMSMDLNNLIQTVDAEYFHDQLDGAAFANNVEVPTPNSIQNGVVLNTMFRITLQDGETVQYDRETSVTLGRGIEAERAIMRIVNNLVTFNPNPNVPPPIVNPEPVVAVPDPNEPEVAPEIGAIEALQVQAGLNPIEIFMEHEDAEAGEEVQEALFNDEEVEDEGEDDDDDEDGNEDGDDDHGGNENDEDGDGAEADVEAVVEAVVDAVVDEVVNAENNNNGDGNEAAAPVPALPFPFKPEDIFTIYPLIVTEHNHFIADADNLDILLPPNVLNRTTEMPFRQRLLRIQIRAVGGVRDGLPDLDPDQMEL